MILNPLVGIIARIAAGAARAAKAVKASGAGQAVGRLRQAASKRYGAASGKSKFGRAKTAYKDAKRVKRFLDSGKKRKPDKRRKASEAGRPASVAEGVGRLGRSAVPVGSRQAPQRAGPGAGSGNVLHGGGGDAPDGSWFQRLINSSEENVLEHLKSVAGLGGGDDAGRPSGGGRADRDLVSRLWNLMNPEKREKGSGTRGAVGGGGEEMFLSTELEHSAATAQPATGTTAGEPAASLPDQLHSTAGKAAGRPEGVGAPMPHYDPDAIRIGAPTLGRSGGIPTAPRTVRPAPAPETAPVGGGDDVDVNVESPDVRGAGPDAGTDKSMFSRLMGRLGGTPTAKESKGFLDRIKGGGEEAPELTAEERDEAVSDMPGLDESEIPPLSTPEEIDSLNKEAQEAQFDAVKATEDENAAREKSALGMDEKGGGLKSLLKVLATAGVMLIPLSKRFAESLIMAQEHLAAYSGTMATAMGELERQQFGLDIQQAQATEDTFYMLTTELQELRENTQPLREMGSNVKNLIGAGFLMGANKVMVVLNQLGAAAEAWMRDRGWWIEPVEAGPRESFREALDSFHDGDIEHRNPLIRRNRAGGDLHQQGNAFPHNLP